MDVVVIRQSRRLQAVAGIQNMNSQIEVTDQTVSNVANIVTFTQTLNYDATAAANDTTAAEDLVFAPWRDTAYNSDLAGQLTQVIPDAFGSLGAPISPPVIVDPSGTTEDSDSKSKDSSTNPALYSLAALALIPIAGVAYFVYRRKQSKNSEAAASVNNDDEVGPAHPAASARSTRQQREGGRYLPTNKDQARSVNPSSPLASRNPSQNQPITAAAAVREREDPPTVQAVAVAMPPAYLPDQKDQCRHVPLENRSDDPPLVTAVVMDKETMSNSDNV